jgi:hypothetical protein
MTLYPINIYYLSIKNSNNNNKKTNPTHGYELEMNGIMSLQKPINKCL